jgi:hypothetical protein
MFSDLRPDKSDVSQVQQSQAKPSIDLNCDVAESYGAYRIGNDEALLKLASSVNIACGYHGGDPAVMRRTVELAVENGIAIGNIMKDIYKENNTVFAIKQLKFVIYKI